MTRVGPQSAQRNRELQRKRNQGRARGGRQDDNESRRRELERRPFIGWDGEGYRAFLCGPGDHEDDHGAPSVLHRYMLFGCSTGQYVSGADLSTRDILELILFVGGQNPGAFHVGFAFDYDVNMILRDLDWRHLAILTDTGTVKWNAYRIKHIPHKLLSISREGVTVTIFDVFGFFHVSYLRALAKFGIGKQETLQRIAEGKDKRGWFTLSDLPEILDYWRHEISLLPELMDKLRDSCYTAGFYITQWHGPGALASYALRKHNVHEWHPKPGSTPKDVQLARRLAYAGGRFQDWKCGVYDGPVYTADINSAYAASCRDLPNLASGQWRRIPKADLAGIHSRKQIARFALYRIRYDARNQSQAAHDRHIPFPLFHRDADGNLTWPPSVEGWYWSPEAATVAGSPHAAFLDGWEFVDDGTYPFRDLIQGAYDRRLQLQAAGDYAEKAYKWFLASIYGQFAQRVGWDKRTRTAPRSHCLEWAGYITSYCRALVYVGSRAISLLGGMISIDTDGITSTVPFPAGSLPGGTGDKLGEWKLESFSGIVHWQNGIYWLRDGETGEWADPKTRGIPRGKLPRQSAVDAIHAASTLHRIGTDCHVTLSRERFIGYRQSLQHQWDSWRTWKRETVEVAFGGTGKGRHVPMLCQACSRVPLPGHAAMHTVSHLWSHDMLSHPHELPWLAEPQQKEANIIIDGGIWDDERTV